MTTDIQSNGSKWAGEQPDTVETLLQVLAEYPLDRTFEGFGNFAGILTAEDLSPGQEHRIGLWSFFGNFLTLSHVFNIETDDPAVFEPLRAAIAENIKRPDYLAQEPYAVRKAREEAATLARYAERARKLKADARRALRA